MLGYPEFINPTAKWMVAGAQVVVLCVLAPPSTRLFGLTLAAGFALSNLTTLALNGFSAFLFQGWGGTTDSAAFLLLAFLVAQFVVFATSVVALKHLKRQNGAPQIGWAVCIVLSWAVSIWLLGRPPAA